MQRLGVSLTNAIKKLREEPTYDFRTNLQPRRVVYHDRPNGEGEGGEASGQSRLRSVPLDRNVRQHSAQG
jgi:hypothetical protein